MKTTIISWILRVIAAVILLQTLFFKFTGAQESVELFTQLGMEPHGRILTGIVELIAAILLLVPRTAAYGGLLSAGLMGGAIMSHITKLGFAGPMLSLAIMAFIVLGAALATVYIHRAQIPLLNKLLGGAKS